MTLWSRDRETPAASVFGGYGLLAAAALVAVATWSGHPALTVLGLLVLLTAALARVWSGLAFWRLRYERLLETTRAFVGDEVALTVRLANPKPIPLPWITVGDRLPRTVAPDGPTLPHHDRDYSSVDHAASLWWYRRRSWEHRLVCRRRGRHYLGPALLESGDLFGFYPRAKLVAEPQSILVYPELIPLPELGLSPNELIGDARVRRDILPDPLRVVGVREYRPGDARRQIHWKASVRHQALQTKVLEPTATCRLLLALDVPSFDHPWLVYREDLFELAISALASVAYDAVERRFPVGLVANTVDAIELPPVGRPQHLMRLLEALALVELRPGAPLPELLRRSEALSAWGTTLVVAAARVQSDLADALQSFARTGHPVTLLYTGLDAPPDLILLAAAPVFWWRAGAIATAELEPRSVTARFQFGLLPLALAGLLAEPRRPAETAVAAVAHFIAGLVAAGLARDRASQSGRAAWAALGLAVATVTGGLALGLGAALSAGLLGRLFAVATSPIAALVRLLASLFDRLAGSSPPDAAEPIGAFRPPVGPLFDFDLFGALPPWLQAAFAVIGIAIALFGLVVAFHRVAERVRLRFAVPGRGGDPGEPTGDGLGGDLRLLWRRILAWLARFRFRLRHGAASSLTEPGAPPLPPEILEVRQIYRALLDLGAQHGAYRWPAWTPTEHLPVLQQSAASSPERLSNERAGVNGQTHRNWSVPRAPPGAARSG